MVGSPYRHIPALKKEELAEKLYNILNGDLHEKWRKKNHLSQDDLLKDDSIDAIAAYVRRFILIDFANEDYSQFWMVSGFINNFFYNRLHRKYQDMNKLFPSKEENDKVNEEAYSEISACKGKIEELINEYNDIEVPKSN